MSSLGRRHTRFWFFLFVWFVLWSICMYHRQVLSLTDQIPSVSWAPTLPLCICILSCKVFWDCVLSLIMKDWIWNICTVCSQNLQRFTKPWEIMWLVSEERFPCVQLVMSGLWFVLATLIEQNGSILNHSFLLFEHWKLIRYFYLEFLLYLP